MPKLFGRFGRYYCQHKDDYQDFHFPTFLADITDKDSKDDKAVKILDHRDLEIVCHFYYLPYECGPIASEFKANFKWLKRNAIDFAKKPPEDKVN